VPGRAQRPLTYDQTVTWTAVGEWILSASTLGFVTGIVALVFRGLVKHVYDRMLDGAQQAGRVELAQLRHDHEMKLADITREHAATLAEYRGELDALRDRASIMYTRLSERQADAIQAVHRSVTEAANQCEDLLEVIQSDTADGASERVEMRRRADA
jgi:signal transduction histidine kinase